MPTNTTNYDIPKPLVNDATDEDLWGGYINDGLDIIDSTLKTLEDDIAAVGAATILAIVYPIGSYYFNETDPTNPTTLFGFGTWVAVTDKFIVGHGSTYTSTGGAATAALTEANMYPHFHLNGVADHVSNQLFVYTATTSGLPGNATQGMTSDGTSPVYQGTTSSVGSGTPFSIIPPYQAAYIWKRTA